jgi:hypothetical protein
VTRSCIAYGLPLSGKRTLIHAIARAAGCKVDSFTISSSRAPLSHHVVTTKIGELTIQTMSGAVWIDEVWDDLPGSPSCMMLVVDAQESRLSDTCAMLERMSVSARPFGRRGCVVVTKQDLSPIVSTSALLSGTRFASWPLFAWPGGAPTELLASILAS